MELKRNLFPQIIDNFVQEEHPEANFLQMSAWGKAYEKLHDKVEYLGFYEEQKLVGTCIAIVKPARRGRYLEIPGGPIIDWRNQKQVKAVMQKLHQIAKEHNCVFARMRPNISDTAANRLLFRKLGLQLSPMHLHAEHTVMLDLSKSLDELMSDMRRQTRYEVRRAQKLGVEVTSSSSTEAFEEFHKTQSETAQRQGFIAPSLNSLLAQHEAYGENARIYKASLEGKTLALGLIILQQPEAIYHEAASTPEGRSLPGAYALQWQIIQDAKQAGFPRYNLFGIAPPNSPKHRYAGVTTFKTGFGGEQVDYLPAHDLVINPAKYQITKIIESVRKKKRRL